MVPDFFENKSGSLLPHLEQGRLHGSEPGIYYGVWSFRHLTLGVIAIFFYVGTEVSVGVNVNLHAMELAESGQGLSFFGHGRLVLWGMDLVHSPCRELVMLFYALYGSRVRVQE